MKTKTITSVNPAMLPSGAPITQDSPLYEGARALAIQAGAIKETDRPAAISYAHGTKSWSIGW